MSKRMWVGGANNSISHMKCSILYNRKYWWPLNSAVWLQTNLQEIKLANKLGWLQTDRKKYWQIQIWQ